MRKHKITLIKTKDYQNNCLINKDKFSQTGRSMVEMLGVLAVIGVLSIVGIAGYKKAMLRHYANEAWDSIIKFQTDVAERALLAPQEKCDPDSPNHVVSYYCSAKKGASGISSYYAGYCYMDRSDLMPSFAEGSYAKFYMYVHPDGSIAQWRNISIDNLCSTLLPEAKEKTSYIHDTIDGVEYRCYRKSASVKW